MLIGYKLQKSEVPPTALLNFNLTENERSQNVRVVTTTYPTTV